MMRAKTIMLLLLAATLGACDGDGPTRSLLGPVVLLSPDGSGAYANIQEALAFSAPGTTIELEDGTYAGDGNRDLDFQGKALLLRSKSGNPAHCAIDCEGDTVTSHRGFYFHSGEGPSSIIEGITIARGRFDFGAGIFCDSSSSPTIRACILSENSGIQGAGIFCAHDSNPLLDGLLFENNEAWYLGGGLECYEASPTLRGCRFLANTARTAGGGGIYCLGSDLILDDCRFESNSGHFGGGVFCQLSTPIVTDCAFFDNWARWCGAGAYVNTGSYPIFHNCTFAWNESTCGASISSDRGSVTLIRNCTMVSNSASRAAGVECDFHGKAVLIRTVIAFSESGLGVCCRDSSSTLDLIGCDLYGNPQGDWVGCVASQLSTFGNIQEDPQFCDREQRDYHLRKRSPCATPGGENAVGAWPVGCD